MKRLIKSILFNKVIAKVAIKSILRCHTFSYKLASRYAIILSNDVHPKHHILRYMEWFLDNIEQGWTVLDVGSNTGMMACMFTQKAKFVYGIEIDQEHIHNAQKRHCNNNIEYICADATTYDYSGCKPVNCITISNTLEHIDNRVDFLKQIIAKVNWADDDRRFFLFRVPMFNREWIVPYKKQLGVEYRLDLSHHTEYTLESFQDELGQADIKIENYEIRFGEIYAICKVANCTQ